MVALPEGTVFLMCVPARMPDLRSLGYISGMESKTERDLGTRHENTPFCSNFRESYLSCAPVVDSELALLESGDPEMPG
jgi:hypothetical protein